MAIALDTERTLDAVLRAHACEGGGYAFETTQVPVGLLADVTTGLESRAQARRVALRLASFRRAELDFTGIEDIGQGFADELFRVVPATQPTLELVPVGIAPRVAEMIRSVQAA